MVKLIITVALTGNVPTKDMNKNLPVTSEEIAEDVRLCANDRGVTTSRWQSVHGCNDGWTSKI